MDTRKTIDEFARDLREETRTAVYGSTKSTHTKRTQVLFDHFPDPNHLRTLAGNIKQHVIENLDTYLGTVEAKLLSNGVKVHWASTAEEANQTVLSIMQARGAKRLVKAKTMVSEEIKLGEFLEKNGIESLETDLGEFIVQLDHDHPSHIVRPIIHKSRREIAVCFEKNGLGAYNDEPAVITMRAREFLRQKYLQADVGVTGANFVSAESGRMVLVTNEGNSRFSLAAPKCHIALVGIEKIVPRDQDLALFLNLLARSATAQQLTVYTEFIKGPRAATQQDGPEEMHVVFVDNGRTNALASDCREILRCIRCGACMNVCPVYRQASGHAYRTTYPGPVGAVLSPLLAGDKAHELADLPKASSLCGACNEVCPVNIPIPELLLRLRDKNKREGGPSSGTPPMGAFAMLAGSPFVWRTAMRVGGLINHAPAFAMPAPVANWMDKRTLPAWQGGDFRAWMKQREKSKAEASAKKGTQS